MPSRDPDRNRSAGRWGTLRLAALWLCLGPGPGPQGMADEEVTHWSFRPVREVSVPPVKAESWVRSPLDAFLLARLEAEGLAPAPEAAPATLLRRLHLDLTGLPPSPGVMRPFLEAWSVDPDEAYAAAVEALLDSPHFGEHWGRHWLDLARYGDSDGYLGDNVRAWAWVYRDWVVGAMNADVPYDQFSIEQLAGDLLPGATPAQRIASGFHRNTLKNTEAGADRELARTKEIVDRVATTGTVWLGLTLGCAECHDHKHDPVSQREFYQFYAFFNNADEGQLEGPFAADPLAELEKPSKAAEAGEPVPAPKGRVPTLAERTKDRRTTRVHVRGDYAQPGEAVEPGTPAILHPLPPGPNPDRLALARWLFEERNPLTARVAVNRIWQHLFGQGLVATSDDFGTEGARPSHPDLLDWLAAEYRRQGWSTKSMIRTIVRSSTYRQSSAARPGLEESGAAEGLLARQRSYRVSAETVRDVHLAASGLLDEAMGGPAIRPPLPEFVTEVGRSVKWPVSRGGERHRRGLYIFLKRTVLYPMLTTFDAPDTTVACSRRERTNTPMQALTLLNDPVFFECAETLGRELHRHHGERVEDALREVVLRCLNREAEPEELTALRAAYRDLERDTGAEMAMIATARIVMNLDEFVTRD